MCVCVVVCVCDIVSVCVRVEVEGWRERKKGRHAYDRRGSVESAHRQEEEEEEEEEGGGGEHGQQLSVTHQLV